MSRASLTTALPTSPPAERVSRYARNSCLAASVAHRMAQASAMWASLDGLSIGDAFGQMLFGAKRGVSATTDLPAGPWRWTDDTHMALSIVRVLTDHGKIDQDALASAFAGEFRREPWRGYAKGTVRLLEGYRMGLPWREEAPALFGSGSYGNGAAMRSAPIGAYFAGDPKRAADEAALSAVVTHAHPEGVSGAIAVAVAASLRASSDLSGHAWLERVIAHVPEGKVREAIAAACVLPAEDTDLAARTLGSGYSVTARDTVPFCLWVVAFHGEDFERALWKTVQPGGDRDTTCAIVGGILAADGRSLPNAWRARCEPLPSWTRRHLAER